MRIRSKVFYKVLLVSILLSYTTKIYATRSIKTPKLVIGLVVDQMRWDYLYRYSERYGNGGFKRLLREGFSCNNTQLNYIPAFTACGHASIFTGSVPALNGITGNEWIAVNSGERTYCTQDHQAITIGSNSTLGKMSPRNLLSTTIGDQLKLATNFRAKVVGVSIKDRGAILPAGHSADAAYWFDETIGRWITSSYYKKELPLWVQSLNNKMEAEAYLKKGWQTIYPIDSYLQSTKDNSIWEGKYRGEENPVFPHLFQANDYAVFKATPFANTLTLNFAKNAIEEEALGCDNITDMLTISLSGTDYVGHQFGPNSIEVEDTYLRLDKDIEDFLKFLDKKVGEGNFLLFVTADHGAANNPQFMSENKISSGFWDAKKLQIKLNAFITERYKTSESLYSILNYQINFDYPIIEKLKINKDSLKADCINYINGLYDAFYAVDAEDLNHYPIPVILQEKIRNGYNKQRSGALQIILRPGFFQLSNDQTGTIHGSWNPYDAHIPLIFFGCGIKSKSLYRKTSVCDIAPTVCAFLQIAEPNSCIGEIISEIF